MQTNVQRSIFTVSKTKQKTHNMKALNTIKTIAFFAVPVAIVILTIVSACGAPSLGW